MGIYSKLRQKKLLVPSNELSSEVRDERVQRLELHERDEQVELNEPVKRDERVKSKKTESTRKRAVKRRSYDLFIDQIKTLNTQTKIYFLLQGKQKNITQMIREAIDEYIEKYK